MAKNKVANLESLDSLVLKHGGGDYPVDVAFGIRPSGVIHLGNLSSLSLASGLVSRIGPQVSNLKIAICDLDLPERKEWDSGVRGFVRHYRDLPDPSGEFGSMAERAVAQTEEFMEGINKVVNVPYELLTLTDIQSTPEFREGLKRILDTPGAMKDLFPKLPRGVVKVYPLCSECGTSYTNSRRRKYNKYADGKIDTHCLNPDCSVGDYTVDVLDTSAELSVHFFIDPLRDAVLEPQTRIHVFGGDYLADHGRDRRPKIEKVERFIKMATPEGYCPDFLIGPVFIARDGIHPMSKGLNNGLTLTALKDLFGEDYPRKIFDFTMSIIDRGYQNVDYALVQENLLNQ